MDPPFKDGGGADGLSADEHPLGDVRLGQAFQADVAGAFAKSPNYRRGAMFVVYDEWGGFFDHVRPPRAADDRASADLNEDFGQMGFRVPAIAISPYSRNLPRGRRGRSWHQRWRVDHGQYGHESILSFISYRFGLGFLNTRHQQARNIGHSFNWGSADLQAPELRIRPRSSRSHVPSVAPTSRTPCRRTRATSRSWRSRRSAWERRSMTPSRTRSSRLRTR